MQLSDLNIVVHQEANTRGQDFVVGDLHGCVAMLEKLLELVHFDREKDRLFCTGDLIDRGPDSAGTLALLKEPWFYPVLGNHDVMLLAAMDRIDNRTYEQAFRHNYDGSDLSPNGPAELEEYLDILMQTPFIRVVGAGTESRFQVLHAERINALTRAFLSDEDLDGPLDDLKEKMRGYSWVIGFDNYGDWFDSLLWGRSLRYTLTQTKLNLAYPISRTFVGHTITVPRKRGLHRFGEHIFLDTGAYQSDDVMPEGETNRFGLTIWNVQENSGVTLRQSGPVEVQILD